jgi:glutamate/tyrosine decarboxylase-like PLP-dependent enzyme
MNADAEPLASLSSAFRGLAALDGAEAPGRDRLLPAGPRLLARAELWHLAGLAERLWARFDAAVQEALAGAVAEADDGGRARRAALAHALGFDEREAALIAATPSRVAAPVRADFVPTAGGHRLVEWNVDPCLGGLAGRRVFDCFARAGRADDSVFHDPATAVGHSLARLRSDGRPLCVAIRRGDLPRWRSNAERLVEVARAVGLDARLATVDEAVRLADERPIDLLRQFHIEHTADPEVQELLRAVHAGRARLVYGFDTELWGDKQWLARLALPDDLQALVPPTLAVAAALPSLRADAAAWLLKPHAGAAGEGVVVGREVTAAAWSAAVARALGEPGWIAQRLVEPSLLVSPYVDVTSGQKVAREEVETLGIFLVDGRFAGAYCRTKAARQGVVIDATASFNVVVTPRVDDPPLSPPLRELWSASATGALPARLRSFETLALEHLGTGGGARTTAAPVEAAAGFARRPLPDAGAPVEELVEALRHDLLPFCHDKRRPEYLAHLDVPPTDLSIAAGTLIRALAQDPVTWTSSRAGTFVEEQLLDWLTELAFPARPGAAAVACSGGTQANLLAVLLARNLAVDGVTRLGLAGALRAAGVRGLRVLGSTALHGSVSAAVRNAGLGDESLVRLPVDSHDRLRLDALAAALAAAAREGDRVALVVLNAGTVGVGAIDPLPEAIALAHRHGARVHVDAAHGAMLLWSRRYADRLDGLDGADSITADPHKILGLNQGLGALLVRDGHDRLAVTKDGAPYFHAPESAPQASRFTLDGTRPLHALAAWILVRHLGRSGYEQIVDHLLGLTARFTDHLSESGAFELYAPPAMNLVGFRLTDGGEPALAALERQLAATRYRLSRYQSSRGAFLRAVFVNPATTRETVDELARLLAAARRR